LVEFFLKKFLLTIATSIQPDTVVILSMDQYLTHYWSFENGTMKDVIGSADMTQGSSSFIYDRFCNSNSALGLNGGWTQVPGGIYFNTPEFSISVWIYPMNVSSWSRIIDFGNGESADNSRNEDNVILSISNGNLKPFFELYSGPTSVLSALSSRTITLNQWQFLTATFNGTNASVYLNGTLVDESNTQNYTRPFSIWRSNCFIGKSNWASDGYSHSYLDDLRFHNKSLTKEEILELMNYNQNKTSKFFHREE
jgi:hypothetical protein